MHIVSSQEKSGSKKRSHISFRAILTYKIPKVKIIPFLNGALKKSGTLLPGNPSKAFLFLLTAEKNIV